MELSKETLVIKRQVCPVCKCGDRTILLSAKHNSPGFLDFIKHEAFYSKAFYESYYNSSLNELLYEIAECNNCQNVYQTEVLSDEGMGLLYNEWLDGELLKEYYSKVEYSVYEENMLKVIKKQYRKKDKVNVMDFGAGYGNFCAIATSLGLNTYAFDLSTDKNDHINNMGVTIINNFDKYKGYFDFIYVNQVFEHLADPGGILKSLRECLSTDGLLFMSVPDCSDIKRIIAEEELSLNLFKLLSPHQHINAFTNKTFKLLGLNAGLKPLTMLDFLQMINFSLTLNESKFLIKKAIKNANYGTGLFFSPILNKG